MQRVVAGSKWRGRPPPCATLPERHWRSGGLCASLYFFRTSVMSITARAGLSLMLSQTGWTVCSPTK